MESVVSKRWLEITTTYGCPVRCDYCPQDKFVTEYRKRNPVKRMTFEAFRTCVDKLPAACEISFAGFAEPWINPECSKMVLYAHQRGFLLQAYTTCVGMLPSDVDVIKRIPFKQFGVHLPNTNVNEMTVRIDQVYLEVIEKLFESQIQNAIFFYHTTGDRSVAIHPLIGGLAKRHNVELQTRPLQSRAGNVWKEIVAPPKGKQGVRLMCDRLYCNVLLPNGDVTLCCMDWGLNHVLGNLLKTDYEALFVGEQFLKIVEGLKSRSSDILCRRCEWSVPEESLFTTYGIKAKARIRMMLKRLLPAGGSEKKL